jgi:hypothetical protein
MAIWRMYFIFTPEDGGSYPAGVDLFIVDK